MSIKRTRMKRDECPACGHFLTETSMHLASGKYQSMVECKHCGLYMPTLQWDQTRSIGNMAFRLQELLEEGRVEYAVNLIKKLWTLPR